VRWSIAAAVVATAPVVGFAACGTGPVAPRSPEAMSGQSLATRYGCTGCHAVSGRELVGPSWNGAWGTDVALADGGSVRFDDAYVRESVRRPAAKVRAGRWVPMPAFGPDRVSDADLDAIVAYLRELGRG
jgi:cytochrome c oxidase subunit 2